MTRAVPTGTAASAWASTTGTAAAVAMATAPTTVVATALIAAAMAATPSRSLAGLAEVFEDLGVQAGPGARGPRQAALRAGVDAEIRTQVLRVGIRLLGLRYAEVEGFVDHRPPGEVVPVDQGDGHTGVPGPGGATDPVEVGFLILRALVVDDMGDVLDVDPTCRDIGSDEDVDLAVAERPQGLFAGPLAEVAVNRSCGKPTVDEFFGDFGRGPLGPTEDDGQATILGLEDAGEHLDLIHRVRTIDELLDSLDGVALGFAVLTHRPDVGRLGHVPAGQRDDGPGHRRREEHRLATGGSHGEQLLDIGQEAEVEHLIGLIKDDGPGLAEVEVALVSQVDQPSRGSDDDLNALAQRLHLRLVCTPAVDGEDADTVALPGPLEVVGHLNRELTRRSNR